MGVGRSYGDDIDDDASSYYDNETGDKHGRVYTGRGILCKRDILI